MEVEEEEEEVEEQGRLGDRLWLSQQVPNGGMLRLNRPGGTWMVCFILHLTLVPPLLTNATSWGLTFS